MHRFIYRARWFALLAFFAVGGVSSASVPEGLSYGHVSWRPMGPHTAEFTVLSAFRRIYPGSGPDGLAITGDLFEDSDSQARLCFQYLDDDCLYPLTYEVIDYNAEEGWLLGRAVTPPGPQPLPGTSVTVTQQLAGQHPAAHHRRAHPHAGLLLPDSRDRRGGRSADVPAGVARRERHRRTPHGPDGQQLGPGELGVELNAIDLPENAYASPYVPLWGPSGSSIDIFKLWIDGVLQTGDGRLSCGNIQIHRETLAMAP